MKSKKAVSKEGRLPGKQSKNAPPNKRSNRNNDEQCNDKENEAPINACQDIETEVSVNDDNNDDDNSQVSLSFAPSTTTLSSLASPRSLSYTFSLPDSPLHVPPPPPLPGSSSTPASSSLDVQEKTKTRKKHIDTEKKALYKLNKQMKITKHKQKEADVFICEQCEHQHDGSYGAGRFCDKKVGC